MSAEIFAQLVKYILRNFQDHGELNPRKKNTAMRLALSLWEILGVVVTARDVHAASSAAAMLANLPPSCARGFRVTASALLLFYPSFSPYPICCFFRPPSYVFRVMLPRRLFCRCAVLETFSVFLSARYSLPTTINTVRLYIFVDFYNKFRCMRKCTWIISIGWIFPQDFDIRERGRKREEEGGGRDR